MNLFLKRFLRFLCAIGVFCPTTTPSASAASYSPEGMGTLVFLNGDFVLIVVRMELWGEGVWNDPTLPYRWEKIIEDAWNDGSSANNVKYKCYKVHVDAEIKVSATDRPGPDAEYGTPGYHQIWVPETKPGDMANAYSAYGLYLPEGDIQEIAYGTYEGDLAEHYASQMMESDQSSFGSGTTSAFIWNPLPLGADGEKKATWGTMPSTLADSAVGHEFGHLLGVSQDGNACDDNIMSPMHGVNDGRLQPYPTYFYQILHPLNLACQWNIRTDVHMDATAVGTYFPPKIDAHNEFILQENSEKIEFAAVSKSSDFVYDFIEPQFTCNTFVWEPHNGRMKYRADIFYNLKDDLKTGGRLYLSPTVLQEPTEEIKNIFGCGAQGGLKDLSMVNPPIHHNLLYGLIGKNLQATPYTYQTDEDDPSCPSPPEKPLTEQYYHQGVLIDGAVKESRAEHFPNADLFGAQFTYDIRIENDTALPR